MCQSALKFECVILTVLNLCFASFPHDPHSDLLHGIAAKLLHMKAVQGDHGLGEDGFNNGLHTVGKVHGYFFYAQTLQSGKFLEYIDNIFDLSAFYYRDNRSLSTMSLFIGDNRVEFTSAKGCFINAQVGSHVFREEQPLLCV